MPSWNDGHAKQSILNFVDAVTREGSPDFVAAAERIATFDNDGTLWCEQPMYIQLAFALDRVKALAPSNPDWNTKLPFNAVLSGDLSAVAATGERGLVELIAATHAGMTTDTFAMIVTAWLATARHPRFDRPYTELVYQPMMELLAYLRSHEFKTFIVSGGGIELMRPWTERIYGIPPEQVIGSSIKTRVRNAGWQACLFRLPEINFVDDKAGKPVGINEHVGRSADRRFWKLGRRPRDAAVDDPGRRSSSAWAHRPSYRRRTGICLRPPIPLRQARPSARCRRREPLGRGQYEG